jgi:mono/diheme cytochrome c family protein
MRRWAFPPSHIWFRKTKIELEAMRFKMPSVDTATLLSKRMLLALSRLSCIAVLILNTAALGWGASSEEMHWLSPSAIASTDDSHIYLLCPGVNEVRVLNFSDNKEYGFSVLAHATGLTLDSKSQTLYVSASDNQLRLGSVAVYQLPQGKLLKTWPAGYGATSPVLSPDGETLFLCNQFDGTVAAYDTKNGSQVFIQPTSFLASHREPLALDVTPDSNFLVISHSLPGLAANLKTVASTVSILDAHSGNLLHELQLPNGSIGLRGIRVSSCGKYVSVAHLVARFSLPATHVDRGWMNSNALTLIDLAERESICTILLDQVDFGAANPWALTWSADSSFLYVTHAGTHEVSRVHFDKLMERVLALPERERLNVSNNFLFLNDLRERINLSGNGPRSLCVQGEKVYVAHYFSDSVEIVDFGRFPPAVKSIALQSSNVLKKKPEEIPVYWGERLFNDGALCYQGWQSCASCHSYDARIDGLNWDLMNDGIGNPKNTKSLLLSHKTPPSMSLGVRATAETAVRSGIRYILFKNHTKFEAEAIDEYLKSLAPLPSPYLDKEGKLSAKAEQGKKLFESDEVGCAQCHNGAFYTDTKQYDVGTANQYDKPHQPFDTPTLVEVWRTAPYLHDGSALTVYEVLTTGNLHNSHGKTKHLSESELEALEAYVLSL